MAHPITNQIVDAMVFGNLADKDLALILDLHGFVPTPALVDEIKARVKVLRHDRRSAIRIAGYAARLKAAQAQ